MRNIQLQSKLFLVCCLVYVSSSRVRIPRCAEIRVKCAAGHHCEDTPTGITCAPDPVCPQNEIFKICASDCEETCFQMGRPCTLNCLPPKCQCQDGFVRERGRCIDPKQCPNRINPTTTQSYIDEPITPSTLTCESLPTIRILCVEGYQCEIVGGSPTCVPHKLKPNPAAKSQVPVTCATTLMLCKDGTQCKDIDGKPQCVKDNSKSSQESFPCANVRCAPDQYCEFYQGSTMCVPRPGPCAAVRCAGGECIEYDDTFGCFSTNCGQNEEFKRCASCEPTCGPIVPCLDVCQPPACQCNADKTPRCAEVRVRCLPNHHCEDTSTGITCAPDPDCNENEEFKNCAFCEPTCGPIVPCLAVCQPPKCQCVLGYVRNEGKCIQRSECKENENGGNMENH